jgi:hypothetical protein
MSSMMITSAPFTSPSSTLLGLGLRLGLGIAEVVKIKQGKGLEIEGSHHNPNFNPNSNPNSSPNPNPNSNLFLVDGLGVNFSFAPKALVSQSCSSDG